MDKTTEISLDMLLEWFKKSIVLIIVLGTVSGAAAYFYSKNIIQPSYTCKVKLCSDSDSNDSQRIQTNTAIAPQHIALLDVLEFYRRVSDTSLQYLNETGRGKFVTDSQVGNMIYFPGTIADTSVFEAQITGSDPDTVFNVANAVAEEAPIWIKEYKKNDVLNVVSYPVRPTRPSGPDITRNTIIGAVIGAVVAFLIVAAKEYFDTRLKSPEQLTEMYSLPVLGVVPNFSFDKENDKED